MMLGFLILGVVELDFSDNKYAIILGGVVF
jgi:hypothetical protein